MIQETPLFQLDREPAALHLYADLMLLLKRWDITGIQLDDPEFQKLPTEYQNQLCVASDRFQELKPLLVDTTKICQIVAFELFDLMPSCVLASWFSLFPNEHQEGVWWEVFTQARRVGRTYVAKWEDKAHDLVSRWERAGRKRAKPWFKRPSDVSLPEQWLHWSDAVARWEGYPALFPCGRDDVPIAEYRQWLRARDESLRAHLMRLVSMWPRPGEQYDEIPFDPDWIQALLVFPLFSQEAARTRPWLLHQKDFYQNRVASESQTFALFCAYYHSVLDTTHTECTPPFPTPTSEVLHQACKLARGHTEAGEKALAQYYYGSGLGGWRTEALKRELLRLCPKEV